jgi:hypothetical protein
MQITGLIKRIEKTESFGANGFEARNLIVVTEEQYAQTILVKFTQGKVVLLDDLEVNQRVKIDINLKGKEVLKEGKPLVFNSIEGWRIEKLA